MLRGTAIVVDTVFSNAVWYARSTSLVSLSRFLRKEASEASRTVEEAVGLVMACYYSQRRGSV